MPATDEVATPNLNALVEEGINLNRAYGRCCSIPFRFLRMFVSAHIFRIFVHLTWRCRISNFEIWTFSLQIL